MKKSMYNSKTRVFVAMSGGVDSSVTAALLKNKGYNVTGVHIKMWSDPSIPCTTKEDRYDAMRAAAYLDIPFETWDLTDVYKKEVVKYMVREYTAGRTPNPDVMCNRHVKFGAFLKRALEKGADYIATGHYMRLHRKIKNQKLKVKSYELAIASDLNKDQSYFLWTLTQKQLQYCLFPLGDYTKPTVRSMAKDLELPNAEKPDSQGVCFIGELDMEAFLKNYIPLHQGSVITTSGTTVGEHNGLQFYTIGQRHGLEIGGGIPYYVTEKDFKNNTLVVAEGPYDKKLFSDQLTVSDINWIAGTPPNLPLECEARIRYRQPLQKCTLSKQATSYPSADSGSRAKSKNKLQAVFHEPQRAVTSGQSIVFYKNTSMLGGGIIV